MRVALFITCFNDTIFPQTGKAVVTLLERLGHTVEFPFGQTCCGQMHYNTGYQHEAVPLIRHFVDVFRSAEVCVAADNSCLMQIGGALHRQRAGVGVVHLAEILAATESEQGARP